MPTVVDLATAMRRLGLHDEPTSDLDAERVRHAYLAAVRREHPDVNAAPGAGSRTAALTEAYTVVRAAIEVGFAASHSTEPPPAPSPPQPVAIVELRQIADDTIEVDAPIDHTYGLLVQAAHRAGDVTFLDRSAALLQILVQFVDEPPCQVVFDLQGRAAKGTTEIFCTIESLEDRPPPPIDAVTRFVTDQLTETASR